MLYSTCGGASMSVSIKLSKKETELAESYCNEHSIPMEEAFKRAFFEMLEDEHDAASRKKHTRSI